MKSKIALTVFLTAILVAFTGISALYANCEIGEVSVEVMPCDETGHFNVVLDFEFANVGDNGFKVQGNGNIYGIFPYEDLPVTIGPLLGDGTTVYEFVVRDMDFPDCSNWTEIDPVDCEGTGGDCNIWDMVVDDHPCNDDGEFYVYLDFEYENVGGDGFKLFVNGDLMGIYPYDDLPLNEVGPFIGDGTTIYHFLVRDVSLEGCAEDQNLGPIDCGGGGGECNIHDLFVEPWDCDDAGNFLVDLTFQYTNVSGDGFKLFVNDDLYGVYQYDDLPLLELGPFEGDGVTSRDFFVRDVVHADCNDSYQLEPIDCEGGGGEECNLWGMTVDVLPCNDDGFFMAEVDFNHQNTSEAFLIWVNGVVFDDYAYASLPVTVGPLEGDGATVYHFVAADAFNDDCATNTHIEPVDCDGTGGDCFIGEIGTTVLPCDESDHFYVLLDFEYENVGELGFNVHGNGNNYGDYEYEDLPVEIGPLLGDGTTVYEFGVTDNVFEDCGSATAIDPVDCASDPQLNNFTGDIITCNGNSYQLRINMVPDNVTGTTFTVEYNEGTIGQYNYADLPVTIGPFTTDGTTAYYFIIKDGESSGFGNWMKMTPFTCENLGIGETTSQEPVRVWFDATADQLVVAVEERIVTGSFPIIELTDVTGRQVAVEHIGNTITRISTESMPSGLVIYRLSAGSESFTGKVLVK